MHIVQSKSEFALIPLLHSFRTFVIYSDESSLQAGEFISHPAIQGIRISAYCIAKDSVVTNASKEKISWLDRMFPALFLRKTGLNALKNCTIVLFTESKFLLKVIEKLAAKNTLLYWGNLQTKKAQVHFSPQSNDSDSITSFIHCIQKVRF
ncbi:hypothetical protein [Schleiferia thermophila]|uniref:hypothetical protein n=1 Tax=Schleiferia thermophila TaxID=884107 RepID=UPI003EECD08D